MFRSYREITVDVHSLEEADVVKLSPVLRKAVMRDEDELSLDVLVWGINTVSNSHEPFIYSRYDNLPLMKPVLATWPTLWTTLAA